MATEEKKNCETCWEYRYDEGNGIQKGICVDCKRRKTLIDYWESRYEE